MKARHDDAPTGAATRDRTTDDAGIRALYQANAGRVDVEQFLGRLRRPLASSRKRARRGSTVRRLGLVAAGLMVAAAIAVGIWQAAEHLGRPEQLLVIGDPIDTSSTTGPPPTTGAAAPPSGSPQSLGSGYATMTLQVPRSLAELELADLWRQFAAGLGVDPSTARVRFVWFACDADALVEQLYFQADTPDGKVIMMRATAYSDPQYLEAAGSTSPAMSGRHSENTFVPKPVFAGVDGFCAALDHIDLVELAAQAGLDIRSGAVAPDVMVPSGHAVHNILLNLGWSLFEHDDTVLTTADELAALAQQEGLAVQAGLAVPTFVAVDGEQIDRLEAAQVALLPLPALRLDLSRTWLSGDQSGRITDSAGGSTEAYAVLRWPEDVARGKTTEARPVDGRLDGLAFTTPDRSVGLIREGEIEILWSSDDGIPCSNVLHPSASYGVCYSLGKTLALRATELSTLVEEVPPMNGQGAQGYVTPTGRTVVAVPIDDPDAEWALLEFPFERELPPMDRIVFDQGGDRLWLSEFSYGDQAADGTLAVRQTLLTAQPHTSDLVEVPLGHPLGGDFAVSPDGNTIFYLGQAEDNLSATLRTADVEKELSLGLATAYHPVFSPDGTTLCLVGSEKVDGPTSLWLYDLESGDRRQIESTEGLTPTHPAFSPDGKRIAFRHYKLGDIWTVSLKDGALTRYALTTEEAPIAW